MTDDPGALHAAFRALPPKARSALLLDLLREAGVRSLVIPGRQGEVETFTADRTVAPKYLKNGVWSREIVGLARRFLEPAGGTWIDLGANIGLTTIPLARLPGVRCHAIEADPDNFALLRRNLERNDVTGAVTARHAAVVARAGPVVLERASANLGDHRVRIGEAGEDTYGEAARDTVTVPGLTLDELIDADGMAGPVVVKMDIQGAEPLAWSGGARVMARADLLLTEYWPYGLRRLPVPLADYHAMLAGEFSWAARLADGQDPDSVRLRPVAEIIAGLDDVGRDRPIEAIDLVLARSPAIPGQRDSATPR